MDKFLSFQGALEQMGLSINRQEMLTHKLGDDVYHVQCREAKHKTLGNLYVVTAHNTPIAKAQHGINCVLAAIRRHRPDVPHGLLESASQLANSGLSKLLGSGGVTVADQYGPYHFPAIVTAKWRDDTRGMVTFELIFAFDGVMPTLVKSVYSDFRWKGQD